MSADPFACFDSESDDECICESSDHFNDVHLIARDESCGVLSFHPNTEQSLLMHVQNQLNKNSNDATPKYRQILTFIDDYCMNRHWMMCVGPEKGKIIADSLEKAFIKKRETFFSSSLPDAAVLQNRIPFVCVEIGTYCGYGSIFLTSIFKDNPEFSKYFDFHLFTVEINPEFIKVASAITALAKLDCIHILENDLFLDGSTAHIGKMLTDAIHEVISIPVIDFLLIDHDKENYLTDLQRIDSCSLLQKGSVVAADNVIFAEINDYVHYMKGLEKLGRVATVTEMAHVEYCSSNECYQDGIGKCSRTVYLLFFIYNMS